MGKMGYGLITGLIAVLMLLNPGFADEKCTTKGCHRAARVLRSSMDLSADPCEDFYQFACGKWIDQNPVPKDATYVSQMSQKYDDIMDTLKDDLEAPINKEEPEAYGATRKLYKSCMDTGYLNKYGIKELRWVAKEKLGGWPMIHQTVSPKFKKLIDVMLALGSFSINPVFHVSFFLDPENSDAIWTTIYPENDILSMHRAYYGTKFSRRGANEILIRDVAEMIGGNKKTIPVDAYKISRFETSLANFAEKITWDAMDIKSRFRKLSVGELYTTIDETFDWLYYLNKVFEGGEYKIKKSSQVILYSEDYIRLALKLIQTTDERVVRNFLVWRGIRDLLKYAGPEAEKPLTMMIRRTAKMKYVEPPRSRKCTKIADSWFPKVLGRIFVRRYYDNATTPMVEQMIKVSKELFRLRLNETSLIDENTRAVLYDKVEKISGQIGHSRYLKYDGHIDLTYRWADVKHKSYLMNIISLRRAIRRSRLFLPPLSSRSSRKDHGNFDQKGRGSELANTIEYFGPALPSSRYFHQILRLEITAAILQRPFFDLDFPDCMNFGSIGSLVLHEMGHAFGTTGIQYDSDGNLLPYTSEATWRKFSNRVRCFVKQYDEHVYKGVQMDGFKTTRENVADFIAIWVLKQAYQKYKEERGTSPLTLPGIKLSEEQILYTRWAQMICSNESKDSVQSWVLEQVQSPSKPRVNGSLRNSKDFAEAFKCPLGSFMNPQKKCHLY